MPRKHYVCTLGFPPQGFAQGFAQDVTVALSLPVKPNLEITKFHPTRSSNLLGPRPGQSLAAFCKVCRERGLGCLLRRCPFSSQLVGSPGHRRHQSSHAQHGVVLLATMLTRVLDHPGRCLGASKTMSCLDWHASQYSPTQRRSSIGLLFSLLCRLCPDHRPTLPTPLTCLLGDHRLPPGTSAASYCRPVAFSSWPASNWLAPSHSIPAMSSCRSAHGMPINPTPLCVVELPIAGSCPEPVSGRTRRHETIATA